MRGSYVQNYLEHMRIFIIRASGFNPEYWPAIAFRLESDRDKLLKESSPGDRIAFVGTLRKPTPASMRGRLLGMAEIGRIPVDYADIVGEPVSDATDYYISGQHHGQKAIPMVRAWSFTRPPMLLDVLEQQLPYHATSQAVALSQSDAVAVLKLDAVQVTMPDSVSIHKALLHRCLGVGKPTTGPKPISWIREASRDSGRESFTYVFRFGCTNVWKIGHAINVTDRLKQVNCHIPSEVVPSRWREHLRHRWDSEIAAYEMEQRVLNTLTPHRTEGERVKCMEPQLRSAWQLGIEA